MAAAIRLRADYTAKEMRDQARCSTDANQARRLLSVAEIYDNGTRTDAARMGGVGLQVIRDWVLRFNAEGPDGLIDRKAPGKVAILDEACRKALVEIVESGPVPAIHGVVRWRLVDLVQWVWEEFGISVSRQTLGRELRALGYAKLSARPRHHAHDPVAVEAFKKTSPSGWRRSGRSSPKTRP